MQDDVKLCRRCPLCDLWQPLDEIEAHAVSCLRVMGEEEYSHVPTPTRSCLVCLEAVRMGVYYEMKCPEKHGVCIPCLQAHCKICIQENIPITCVGHGCEEVLTADALSLIFLDPTDQGLVSKYEKQVLERVIQSMSGAVGCPSPDCSNWIIVENMDTRVRVHCDVCQLSFCSICKRKYHYGVACEEVYMLTKHWLLWLERLRIAYLEDLNGMRPSSSEAIEAHHNRRKQELAALEADELWKEQHCKVCPQCYRVVEKTSGCNTMICGRDRHGGNVQDGCGAKFNFETALPYRSVRHAGGELTIPSNEILSQVVHKRYRCGYCKSVIRGIRFECVNCIGANYCIVCEDYVSYASEHRDHIFRMVWTLD